MEYKETYEKFWESTDHHKFEEYERNRALHRFFPRTEEPVRVADVAGGSGIVSAWLMERGYEVDLIEFSDQAVAYARKRGVKNICQQMIHGEGSLPYEDASFDIVFFGDIIEHLFDVEGALKEMRRILKPGGKIIVSCPNIAYWRFRTYYLLDGDFERIDVAKQKPWEQEHIRFFNIRILKELFGLLDFRFNRYIGVNDVWHSRRLAEMFPNVFSHTLIVEFYKQK